MKHFTSSLALSCVFSSLLVGCIGDNVAALDDDELDLAADSGATSAAGNDRGPAGPKFLPKACSEIADRDANAADGEYTLYVDGDEAKPWIAYCHNVWNGGATFLPLRATNTAMYKAGGASSGTDVVTTYTKLRIDPSTLMIDISDQTFATSTGELFHSGGQERVTSMPFGVAMACGGGMARAKIDLSVTPFAPDDLWPTHGSGSTGGGSFSADGKALELWAEGFCGWTGPELAPFNPMNDVGDYALLVVYK